MPRIISVGTAIPAHRLSQTQAKKSYAELFENKGPLMRFLPIFDHAGVNTRYPSKPLAFYQETHSFKERNDAYVEQALELGQKAIVQCLRNAGAKPQDIGHIYSVTTTGLATPSLEARLVPKLGLPSHVKRTPIFGTGCASGAVGLSRAMEYLEARPAENALVFSVELCSLTFQNQNRTVRNLVASALFGDGAAAVLVAGDKSPLSKKRGRGPRLLFNASHLYPNSLEMMGWEFSQDGMAVVLAPQVPELVLSSFGELTDQFLKARDLGRQDIAHWLLHPGGLKVIEAYEKALNLTPAQTRFTRRMLMNYGNLSSASIFFILKDALSQARACQGQYGLLAAMGPGFAAEFLLLQW